MFHTAVSAEFVLQAMPLRANYLFFDGYEWLERAIPIFWS
jgi:hypothetical protein